MSENPLSEPDTAIADNRLQGTWVSLSRTPIEDAPSYLSFMPDDAGATLVLIKSAGRGNRGIGSTSGAMLMFPSSIDAYSFMNLQFTSSSSPWTRDTVTDDIPLSTALAAFKFPLLLLRYEIGGKGLLRIWPMSDEMVMESIKSGRLVGTINEDRESVEGLAAPSAIISANTKEFRAYVREIGPETVFGEGPAEFRRIY